MKNGDIILLIVLFVAIISSVLFIFLKPKAVECVVYENGTERYRYPLNEDLTVMIPTGDDHYNILEIKDGKANVAQADCANQICVHTAPISKVGDSIICLPHKLSFILESE